MENNQLEIAKKLDLSVYNVLGENQLQGFERAFQYATAIETLEQLLTPTVMKPIMRLQGNKLGFLTDKDKTGGYDEATVKKCVIQAVLLGLQPSANQFNIISGQMYPTKEGCGYLLNEMKGLKKTIIPSVPVIADDKKSATVEVVIRWTINGKEKSETITFPIKMDAYTSVDSLIGKATRKARAWLLSELTGVEITDGDVQDAQAISISTVGADVVEEVKVRVEEKKSPESTATIEDVASQLFGK